MAQNPFFYGGQAVIEGVMIRGQRYFSLAVRRINGEIYTSARPLHQIYTGPIRRIPLLRGMIVLLETVVLGFNALMRSADIAISDKTDDGEGMPSWLMYLTLGISFSIGIGFFFLLPLFAARSFDGVLDSAMSSVGLADFLSNLIEGLLRLVLLVLYIASIGLMKDVRRVFAYHGAEHMTVHAREANKPLEIDSVRPFPTAHPRCGTAFLLTVAVIAIFVFSALGRPSLELAILSRVLLIPVIASLSYEIIRLSGAHQGNIVARMISVPGLLLQGLTTKRPDDDQIAVAIMAMKAAIAADDGELIEGQSDFDVGEHQDRDESQENH